jgi:putative endonuclease
MHSIYVLKSLKDGKLYIGCTSNLGKRIISHNNGDVKSTKSRRPLKLIYNENYINKYKAFNKERYYKTAKGKKEIKEKIINAIESK